MVVHRILFAAEASVEDSQKVPVAIVLSGGLALGAYQVGVLQTMERSGRFDIQAVAGASIGAFNAVILAGNTPDLRVGRLQAFWEGLAKAQPLLNANPWVSGHAQSWSAALRARLEGIPGLFGPRPRISGLLGEPGLYDARTSEATLTAFVDFSRLNQGPVRCCLAATDLETSEAVIFDTQAGDVISPSHVRASGSLIPSFPPVCIDDRWLIDGGFSINAPLEPFLSTAAATPAPDLLVVIDLFPPRAPRPRNLKRSHERSTDIMFAAQTSQRLDGFRREWDLYARLHPDVRGTDVLLLTYPGSAEDAGAEKTFDFSERSLSRRMAMGRDDGARLLAVLDGLQTHRVPGLRVHAV